MASGHLSTLLSGRAFLDVSEHNLEANPESALDSSLASPSLPVHPSPSPFQTLLRSSIWFLDSFNEHLWPCQVPGAARRGGGLWG